MSDPVVAFDHVSHYYDGNRVLHDLTFEVREGSIFALLGRNGAGKTTAMQCLMGFLEPTRGSVRILGHDSRTLSPDLRARIAYVSEGQDLVSWMRVDQLVGFQRATIPAFDDGRCQAYLDRLQLPRRQKVKNLSRGQRAQLALALALPANPEVVVLDDPALGLDAVVRREFLEVMIELIQEERRTLLFTSHVLTDVERVADQVAILHDGVLRVNAPLDVVKERIRRVHAWFDGEAPAVPQLEGLVRGVRRRREMVLTLARGTADAERAVVGLGAVSVEVEPLTLEDLFIDYTTAAVLTGGVTR